MHNRAHLFAFIIFIKRSAGEGTFFKGAPLRRIGLAASQNGSSLITRSINTFQWLIFFKRRRGRPVRVSSSSRVPLLVFVQVAASGALTTALPSL